MTVDDGKFSVDKFGHTGIGTISTQHRLEVIEPSDEIKFILSNDFSATYGLNMSTTEKGKIALSLEDGTFRQAMVLGDFGSSDNTKNYFGLSQSKNSGGTWEPNFVIRYDGNVGIATPTPKAKLDINGNFATTPYYHTTNILNNLTLDHKQKSIIIIQNQSANFSIHGILPATDGTHLTIINKSNTEMTIRDESGAASAANRIDTLDGGNNFTTDKDGAVQLIYSEKEQRWICTSFTK